MSTFEHQDLNFAKRKIRVVSLHEHLTTSGHISGSLRQILIPYLVDGVPCSDKLKSSDQYDALSYTWGPPTPTREIIIDGKSLAVRENLWQFLNVWRGIGREIFIDQICIDQTNILERNHQVSFMGDIFSNATKVHVWLGAASFDSDEIMILIQNQHYETSITWTPALFESFCLLLSRPYWSRIWVVQELILAGAYKIHVFCGQKQVRVLQLFYASKGLEMSPGTALDLIRSTVCVSQKLEVTSRYQTLKPKVLSRILLNPKILSWLAVSRFFANKCCNPLDVVYGTQGLVNPKFRVPVDYSISTDELLFRVFLVFIDINVDETSPVTTTTISKSYREWRAMALCMTRLINALGLQFLSKDIRDLTEIEGRIRESWSASTGDGQDELWKLLPKDDMGSTATITFVSKEESENVVPAQDFFAQDAEKRANWVPPLSYHTLCDSQKRRDMSLRPGTRRLKRWFSEHKVGRLGV